MTTTLDPVKRGGAGGVAPSGMTAGPACAHQRVTRFTFAIRLAKSRQTRAKRAAAVAEHLEGVTGAVVIGERADGVLLHLTMAVWPPMRPNEAGRVAEGCPEYVKGPAQFGEPLV